MYRWQHWFRFTRTTGAPARRRDRATLRLEILEDRRVPSFMTTTYPTAAEGLQFGAVAVGDLTGNGIPDLVIGQGGFMVGVYLGNGDGTFQPAGSYVVSGGGFFLGVSGIQIADLRGNGISDIVTGGGVDGVSVLVGNGDGTFQPRRDYLAGEGAWNLVVADLTGNGIPDIVTANYYDGTVSVLLGNGDGTFQPAATYAVGPGPLSIAAGAFGGDSGLPDLAVVRQPSSTGPGFVSVLVNHGDGTFAPHVDYPVGVASVGIALGDFAHTGTLDIAVTNSFGNSVSLLFGNGDHTFQRARDISVPGVLNRLVAGDFNNDGNLDLAVNSLFADHNQVNVLLGDGTGNFAPPVVFPTDDFPLQIVTADLTNDGNADLVTANRDPSYTVLLNDGVWDAAPHSSGTFEGTVGGVTPEQTLISLLSPSATLASSPARVDVSGMPVHDVQSASTPPVGIPATDEAGIGDWAAGPFPETKPVGLRARFMQGLSPRTRRSFPDLGEVERLTALATLLSE
jgi:hypothetical protein